VPSLVGQIGANKHHFIGAAYCRSSDRRSVRDREVANTPGRLGRRDGARLQITEYRRIAAIRAARISARQGMLPNRGQDDLLFLELRRLDFQHTESDAHRRLAVAFGPCRVSNPRWLDPKLDNAELLVLELGDQPQPAERRQQLSYRHIFRSRSWRIIGGPSLRAGPSATRTPRGVPHYSRRRSSGLRKTTVPPEARRGRAHQSSTSSSLCAPNA
jgi:hypothetical protein